MDISRRSFIAGAAALGMSVGAAGLFGCDTAENGNKASGGKTAEPTKYTPKETSKADLVVVGSGASGLAACVEALELGMKVTLIEQTGNLGGVSIGTEGMFGLGSSMQTEAEIALPQAHEVITEEMVYTNYRSDPLLWREYVNQSGKNIDWLLQHGVQFTSVDSYHGASSFTCFHWWVGTEIPFMGVMGQQVQDLGATVMLTTTALDLDFADGAVKGIFAKKADGTIIEVLAPNVILATGGMVSNLKLLAEKTGIDMTNAAEVFPIPHNGDGLRMALAANANEAPTSLMAQCKVAGFGAIDMISIGACFQPNLFVNSAGERFMAEDLQIKKFSALYVNSLRAQGRAYSVLDSDFIAKLENEGCILGNATVLSGDPLTGLTKQLESGLGKAAANVFKADTIEGLADAIGAERALLKTTVDRYNQVCALGADTDYGKDAAYLIPVGSGPYYAVRPDLSLVTSIGGIDVNRKMQVIDADGKPIVGLYSAGVDSCKLYQETYNFQLSGGMVGYCVYSGRTAAQSAFGNV